MALRKTTHVGHLQFSYTEEIIEPQSNNASTVKKPHP